MNPAWSQNLFYFLAGTMAIMGLFSMVTKHILRSAIYLMVVLFLSAGVYLMLDAEFLAGAQVLVYVGGIIVLLVFAVMLTQSSALIEDHPTIKRKLLGALGAGSFFAVSVYLIMQSPLVNDPVVTAETASIATLGKTLVDSGPTGYVLPFEVISILLLGVLIGGSVIARKEK